MPTCEAPSDRCKTCGHEKEWSDENGAGELHIEAEGQAMCIACGVRGG